MTHKFIFFLFCLCSLFQSCDSATNKPQTNQSDKATQTDTSTMQNKENGLGGTPMPCADVLENKDAKHIQSIYSDTMTVFGTHLLFVTRDSALFVYAQKGKDCTLLLKKPIDGTDLYSYMDGSPVVLKDLDGDNQKEVLVTTEKNGGHSHFRVYRIVKENDHIVLNTIRRFEELINPEYDAATGMVRAHWYDRNDYELDEYYKITKDDALVFVKGMEVKGGKVENYSTKKGWGL